MPAHPVFYADVTLCGEGAVDLQQGDILARVPFPTFNAQAANIVKDGKTVNVDLTVEGTCETEHYLLSRLSFYPGLVITQTCDLERGDRPILVCAVRPFLEIFKDQEIGSAGFLRRIKDFSNPGKKPQCSTAPAFFRMGTFEYLLYS